MLYFPYGYNCFIFPHIEGSKGESLSNNGLRSFEYGSSGKLCYQCKDSTSEEAQEGLPVNSYRFVAVALARHYVCSTL